MSNMPLEQLEKGINFIKGGHLIEEINQQKIIKQYRSIA